MNSFRHVLFSSLTALVLLTCSCTGSNNSSTDSTIPPTALIDTSPTDPMNPVAEKLSSPEVLLFNGIGVSTSDWQSTEQIIKSMKLSYRLVNSAQMNAMPLSELSKFSLIVVPGGHSPAITNGLTAAARVRIRSAVRDYGVSYFGICAGAWVAVGYEAETNQSKSFGFSLIYGPWLANWWPNGNTKAIAAIAKVTFADASSRSLVWWGGPSTPEWKNGVVARYTNGKPAISQTWARKGFVVLSGPHPEAPQYWRNYTGSDPDGLDTALTIRLINAALKRQPLSTF